MTKDTGLPAPPTGYFVAIGARGGRARARQLSKARQSEIARLAANARWSRAKRSKAKRP
jgi:hypothetical protein